MAATGILGRLTEGWNPYDPTRLKPRPDGIEPILIEESEVRRSTVRIVILFFLAFCGWAVYAPLDAGVVMQGSVIVSGNRKAVQHPSGGVVQGLFVREGAVVKEGDVVLKINPLNTEASLTSAELQYINLLATESRLMAERLNTEIKWRQELNKFKRNDPRVIEAKSLQVQLYNSRRGAIENELRILREQLAGQEAQSQSLVKVIAEKRSQMALAEKEARNIGQLAKEGFVPESQANAALRAQSSVISELANLQAEVSRNASEMAATKLKMSQTRSTFLKEVDGELAETQKNREAFFSRMESLTFDRSLTEVRSPASGTVVGLKVFTVGGVITAGQVLMEIVPEDSGLIIEAKVQTVDIDKVSVGLPTDLRFSAFNQRTTPVIPGQVKLVGADKLTDPAGGGAEYYLAQVETTPEGRKMLEDYRIQPGMPVEVIVKTGERTFANYILKPLTDRFARSFKED
jgi:protease secretion system membrane fusion protein